MNLRKSFSLFTTILVLVSVALQSTQSVFANSSGPQADDSKWAKKSFVVADSPWLVSEPNQTWPAELTTPETPTEILAPEAPIDEWITEFASPALTDLVETLPTEFTPSATGQTWYVSTAGDNSNDCQTETTTCLTINRALDKAAEGDIIKVAGGIYTEDFGAEVVYVNKSITLSGGWDDIFTEQSQISIIDGQDVRRGFTTINGTILIDKFTIRNGYAPHDGGGVYNISTATLTINESLVTENRSESSGGGIWSNGILIVNTTKIIGNRAGRIGISGGGGGGAGFYNNGGTATISHSSISNNQILGLFYGNGIYMRDGILNLNHSTVSGNHGGYGIALYALMGTVAMNHVTISHNPGYGLYVRAANVSLHNTIISDSSGTESDCINSSPFYGGSLTSLGYNLIEKSGSCYGSRTNSDQFGTNENPVDPMLSEFLLDPSAPRALKVGSPAINAADPATCIGTDQRGMVRPQGVGCDIGAYEHVLSSGPVFAWGYGLGSNQEGYLARYYLHPLAVFAIDENGSPVSGATVNFSAPVSGASVLFQNTASNLVSVRTNENGIATPPPFRANYIPGSFSILSTMEGLPGSVEFTLHNLPVSSHPNFLQNGDFEDTTSLGNYWYQYSSNFGTPFCTFGLCGNGRGTAGPRSGSVWAWLGGVPAGYTEQASLLQSVTIPEGPVTLWFYFWIGAAQSNDQVFNVFVDEKIVRSILSGQINEYPGYRLVGVDLSKYADGGSHTIKFHTTTSTLVNFNLDDISINQAIFGDVAPDHWAWNHTERLYSAGITGGCATSPLAYCPESTVTRAQMAVFLEKSTRGPGFTPPAATGTRFTDVPSAHWAAAWIEQLAEDGITGGCGDGNYCPESAVTRAQMAVFLLKSKYGASYAPPTLDDSGSGFTDVPAEHWAAPWIKQLAAEGITGGCGAGVYCPEAAVTRAQMAVFLVKAFNLP
jgi:hypothetical protein